MKANEWYVQRGEKQLILTARYPRRHVTGLESRSGRKVTMDLLTQEIVVPVLVFRRKVRFTRKGFQTRGPITAELGDVEYQGFLTKQVRATLHEVLETRPQFEEYEAAAMWLTALAAKLMAVEEEL
jgi:hypothetical protein